MNPRSSCGRRRADIASCCPSSTSAWRRNGASPASWEECQAYGRSVGNWPAFPDSAEALQYLKKHYKLVILSNVDNESFAASNKRLQVTFDAILTAEDIGSYKPDDRNFRYMLEKLGGMGIGKEQILHTAESLFHDHEPANRAGLTSCWIYRRHGDTGFGATMAPSVDAEISVPLHQHDGDGEGPPGGAGAGLDGAAAIGSSDRQRKN